MRRGCTHRPPAIKTEYIEFLGKDVTGPDYASWWTLGECEYGNCGELLCPECGCVQGGWGPVECPCEDWIPWRDMRRSVSHAAVKPSIRRRASRQNWPAKRT